MLPKAADDAAAAAEPEPKPKPAAAKAGPSAQQPTAAAAAPSSPAAAAAPQQPKPAPVSPLGSAPEPVLGVQRTRILLSCAMYAIALAVLAQKVGGW